MDLVESKAIALGIKKIYARHAASLIKELHTLQVKNTGRLKSKLSIAPDIDAFRDYYFEVFYAHIFAKSGLPVTIEPCGRAGPDIHIDIDIEVAQMGKNPIKPIISLT